MIGKTLAHYEILDQLGAGGMGEVYRARDTKLGREVALKLLPDELAHDPERVARFRREAKVLASLNHPNIAALYDFEESEGRVFLVMEVAEGEDLSDRLKTGALPVDKAVDVAQQITEGLEEAHAKGIVHRDLKPANVMLADSGRIKLLDFGLARAYHGDEEEGDPARSPTITAAMTQQGVILGTAAYMSPEQARGKPVDKQSDIWAFGALLFEMLTAKRIFGGETISDSIGAILHKDPEWDLLPVDTPPQVRQLLHRCLERDRDRRLRDIGDARVALGEARRDPTGSSLGLSASQIASPTSRRGNWALVGIVTLIALALGALLGSRLLVSETPPPHRKLDLGVELVATQSQSNGKKVTISPNGQAVAFVHDGKVWLQNLDELEAREFAGSIDAYSPFWSPDGTEVGWFQDNRLWKAPTRGGRAVAICEIPDLISGGVGAHWGTSDRIVFSAGSSGIYSVSALGGQPREIIPVAEGQGDLHEPFMLPNDQGFLFVVHPDGGAPGVLALWREGKTQILHEAGGDGRLHFPVYDGGQYILFRLTRGDATEGLWGVEFELSSGEIQGEPFLIEPNATAASVSSEGTLVFVSNPQRAPENMITRVEFDGQRHEIVVPPRSGQLEFAVSPDGERICFTAESRDGGISELWVRDLARGTEMRLDSSSDPNFVPHWSPDGTEIFFSKAELQAGSIGTWRVPADGTSPATRLMSGLGSLVTPDGSSLITHRSSGSEFLSFSRDDTIDLWLAPIEDPAAASMLQRGRSSQFALEFSPDGKYLLYFSGRFGAYTLYLTRFPSMMGRWQVSYEGEAGLPTFSRDGKMIYFENDGVVFAVDFQDGDPPLLGKPRQVMQVSPGLGETLVIEEDGRSLLVVQPTDEEEEEEARPNRPGIKVVQNWTQGIR